MALSFSTKNTTPQKYQDFIESLRKGLTAGRPKSHGIPVLPRREDVPDAERFLLVDLENSKDNTIKLAIDKVTAYVVGYDAGGRSYFLKENARENPPPIHTLFRGSNRKPSLAFDGSYTGLSRAAEEAVKRNIARDRTRYPALADLPPNTPILERIPLGRDELNDAINQLFSAPSPSDQAVGFIVVIQMICEAARFRFIENLVKNSMEDGYDPPIPGPATRSLETHWSNLSKEIQNVPANQTQFQNPVVLRNIKNERVEVDSVTHKVVKGVAMLLYDRHQNANPGPSAKKPLLKNEKPHIGKPTK